MTVSVMAAVSFQSSSASVKMSAAASFQSSTMLRLYRAREEGDYSLTCRGATVKAHSYVLANRYQAVQVISFLPCDLIQKEKKSSKPTVREAKR